MGAAKVRKQNGTYSMGTVLPHYTNDSVVALFKGNDPRIRTNDYGTEKCIVLSDVPGYFQYSDKNGGTATFYNGDTQKPVFTAAREVTNEMREHKCTAPGCTSDHDWTQLTHACGCTTHHKGERYYVIPRLEVCSPDHCDGKHAHVFGLCEECFNSDLLAGKATKDITADGISFQFWNDLEPEAEVSRLAQ
jgi:hypothetical protein